MSDTGHEPRPEAVADLVTVGESMVMFVPTEPGSFADAATVSMHVGGAESNVASFLSDLGFQVRWSSLVGDDVFGDVILRHLVGTGVNTDAVVQVSGLRTGMYVKEFLDGHRTRVHYYRADSAATRLGPQHLRDHRLRHSRILHLSGITAALSSSALDMVLAAVGDRRPGRIVSFDVNYRPLLWPVEVAGPQLSAIANQCDVVFVGLDEAKELWGCETPEDVVAALPDAATVVVKNGAIGAHEISAVGTVFAAAPRVPVVEVVGAGDAFAAGYLGGLLAGWSGVERLRLGHLIAGHALRVTSDYVKIPPLDAFAAKCRASEEQWRALSQGPVPRPSGLSAAAPMNEREEEAG